MLAKFGCNQTVVWNKNRQTHTQRDTNVSNGVTTMKVGGKRPRGRPRLRWMDRVRSDMKEHQPDPKFARNREAWKHAVMTIGPEQGFDRQR